MTYCFGFNSFVLIRLCDLCVLNFVTFVLSGFFNIKDTEGGHKGHKENSDGPTSDPLLA